MDDLPKPAPDDVVVFVAKDVSEGPDLLPRLRGQQRGGAVTEFGHRLADPLKATLYRIANERVCFKCRFVHPLRVTGDGFAVFDYVA